MPFDTVFDRYKKGALHSGSKTGPVVSNPKQATAIYMSEKKKAAAGNTEYQPKSNHPINMLKMPRKFGRANV